MADLHEHRGFGPCRPFYSSQRPGIRGHSSPYRLLGCQPSRRHRTHGILFPRVCPRLRRHAAAYPPASLHPQRRYLRRGSARRIAHQRAHMAGTGLRRVRHLHVRRRTAGKSRSDPETRLQTQQRHRWRTIARPDSGRHPPDPCGRQLMPQPRLWTETLHDGWGQTLRVDEVLFELDSGHQHLLIFRNAMFGTVLALDGVVQTTEKDEFIYHEMLTHVPIVSHGACRKVLIIGGGDGGILREVCRHPAVTSITQVEIDPAVIELSRKYLPNHSRGAFDDPRLTLVIDDGVRFVQECGERFDVIISDSTDPHGPAEALFTSPFYAGVKRCLEPDGIFVAQNGVAFVQTAEVLNTAS